jgi:hypothetical protein
MSAHVKGFGCRPRRKPFHRHGGRRRKASREGNREIPIGRWSVCWALWGFDGRARYRTVTRLARVAVIGGPAGDKGRSKIDLRWACQCTGRAQHDGSRRAGGDRIGAIRTAVVFGRERCGGDHEVSILMAPGDQVRGVAPRAKISMMIMRPLQHWHRGVSGSRLETSPNRGSCRRRVVQPRAAPQKADAGSGRGCDACPAQGATPSATPSRRSRKRQSNQLRRLCARLSAMRPCRRVRRLRATPLPCPHCDACPSHTMRRRRRG